METNKEKNFVSAVVYCFNDTAYIGSFMRELDNFLASTFLKYEIIVVDDSSMDKSVEQIKQYVAHKEGLAVSILNMGFHQGLEASMNAGVNLAIGDFVFEFDSTYVDYDWKVVMDIYLHSLKGFDIVSARMDKKPRLTSRIFYRLFNYYARLQHEVGMETFRVLSRRAINRIHSITKTIPYRKAAYANCGLAVDTLIYKPICSSICKNKTGRMTLAVDSLILFTDVAYRTTLALACIMMLITLVMGIYAVVYKLMENPVEGWTATICFLAFALFGVFVILAIIIKYLQIIVKLNFQKREFLFESIEKIQ
jgi:glycosyltransferase involved in cell wall biosynthesis